MPVSGAWSIRPAVPNTASKTGRVYSVNVVAVAERRMVPSMSHKRMREDLCPVDTTTWREETLSFLFDLEACVIRASGRTDWL